MNLIINCPNCNEKIIIAKINCGKFRHGIYKKTNKQINPHMNDKQCKKLILQKKIFGCGVFFDLNLLQK